MVITFDTLRAISADVPESAAVYVPFLNETMERHDINKNVYRAAMFLSQAMHECQMFSRFSENLNYSADRLMVVWPSRFPSLVIAEKYAKNPEALGNYVYAGRYGNGDEKSGDGYRYRGQGIFMLTFRDNYKEAGRYIMNDENFYLGDNADCLQEPEHSVSVAGWFWDSKGLNQVADKEDVETCTKRINGGTNGLDEREKLYNKAKAALTNS
jgi:putative chitinase